MGTTHSHTHYHNTFTHSTNSPNSNREEEPTNRKEEPTNRKAEPTYDDIYIDATFRGEKVSIRRKEATYYDNLRTVLRRNFPGLSKDGMIIQTNDFDICKGEYVDIPGELWASISPRIHHIKIVTRSTVTQLPPETYIGHQDFYDVNEDSALSPKQCYIIATMGANSVFVPRDRVTDYEDLVSGLVYYFPVLVGGYVVVQTSGQNIDISPQMWPDISKDIENIKVIPGDPRKMRIFVQLLTGKTKVVTLSRSSLVSDLSDLINDYNKYYTYRGEWLKFNRKLSQYNIHDGSFVHQVEHSTEPWD
ncbi:hypothetical protein IW261DRAFT_1524760 [Armillaria novae-zelandiae]|uniref:Ubiquitin-like domain-containing protein n=1 Tax=Armillaria novae-zelandiae TaxID=153914 RepID=A0AA39NEA0_9AGAR|nr:hypothetical protein IW261DRAFT_1524760 [Armillaria novae-zelandiae]